MGGMVCQLNSKLATAITIIIIMILLSENLQNAATLNVADLFHDLSPIACKWREFAGKMGIDTESVLEFTGEPTNINKACLKVTIELLHSQSLADIINALKSMEELEVANYLYRKYCET